MKYLIEIETTDPENAAAAVAYVNEELPRVYGEPLSARLLTPDDVAITIEVHGGLVQDVIGDQYQQITVNDYDNCEDCDPDADETDPDRCPDYCKENPYR